MQTLETLAFDNTFARLPETFYTRTLPTPLAAPYLVSFNADAAALLDLDPAQARRAEFAAYFSGNQTLPGSEPLAMLYAGHQFGHFVPQLGDGRALLLGEISGSEACEVQLKGAGRTPYSRDGDGRAVLRSCIREYLCSEAMHALGIPSTRALCIVGSDEAVYREQIETAAVFTRLAPSHVRFGSFEVFFRRQEHAPIAVLADYVIAKHFPHLQASADKYVHFLHETVTHSARLIAKWQAVGFAHGVMNTDNMSILGLTFDYGPFGFMETYDPHFICNHSDHQGRYAFDQQPHIGLWNLSCLAQALTPLMPTAVAQAALEHYAPTFAAHYLELMRAKLGLTTVQKEDARLILELLECMQANQIDYTNLFRSLSDFDAGPDAANASLRDRFADRAAFDTWAQAYRARLQAEPGDPAARKQRMDRVNPRFILRNHLAQNAIVKAQARDYSEIERLRALLARPFEEQSGMAAYAAPLPPGAQVVAVSCSS